MWPHQEFRREVASGTNGAFHVGVNCVHVTCKDAVTDGVGDGHVVVNWAGVRGIPPYDVKEIVEDGAFQGFDARAGALIFNLHAGIRGKWVWHGVPRLPAQSRKWPVIRNSLSYPSSQGRDAREQAEVAGKAIAIAR